MADTTFRHEAPWVITTARIPYGHIDKMDHMYYGNYLLYFEMARNEWMRAGGLTYKDFETYGFMVPVVEAHVHYKGRVRYDDLIEIRAAVKPEGRTRIRFVYEIRRQGEAEILTTGSSVHVVTDLDGRPQRMPQQLRDLLDSIGVLEDSVNE